MGVRFDSITFVAPFLGVKIWLFRWSCLLRGFDPYVHAYDLELMRHGVVSDAQCAEFRKMFPLN